MSILGCLCFPDSIANRRSAAVCFRFVSHINGKSSLCFFLSPHLSHSVWTTRFFVDLLILAGRKELYPIFNGNFSFVALLILPSAYSLISFHNTLSFPLCVFLFLIWFTDILKACFRSLARLSREAFELEQYELIGLTKGLYCALAGVYPPTHQLLALLPSITEEVVKVLFLLIPRLSSSHSFIFCHPSPFSSSLWFCRIWMKS
jgi:hypothetical protein